MATKRLRDVVALLIAEEVAQRQQTRLDRLVRRAGFPFLKTMDGFNFTYRVHHPAAVARVGPLPRLRHRRALLDLERKARSRNEIHLAVAVAYRAIQNAFDALFVTAPTS